MVVRTSVSSGECAELVLDVERLHEVHVPAAHQLEDVCDKTSSYVGLRHEHAHVLVEPLRIESGTAACCPECCLVYVIIYIAVYVVLFCEFLDAEGRLDASDELVIFHVLHHPVLACELVGVCLHLLVGEIVDLSAVVAVWEIMDFRTYLGEKVIVVEVCAPHRLVHVGHEAYVRVAEDCACPCCICIDLEFFGNFLACSHDGLHVLARHPPDASGSLERAYERACT